MTTAPGIAAVRLTIEHAAVLPRMMEPPPSPVPPEEPKNLPRHLRHLSAGFAARLPIGFCGIAEAAPCEGVSPCSLAARLYLYRDVSGLPRSFGIAGHDRAGIASLFAGDDRLLARLWSARRDGWDAEIAGETLICQQCRVGLVHAGAGFASIRAGRAVPGASRDQRLTMLGRSPSSVSVRSGSSRPKE